jgi:hypothetical protein
MEIAGYRSVIVQDSTHLVRWLAKIELRAVLAITSSLSGPASQRSPSHARVEARSVPDRYVWHL